VLKLLYVIVCVLLAAGCVYALRKKGAPKLYRAGMVLCALLLTAAAAFFGWAGVYYHADNDALAALSSRDTVTVERERTVWRERTRHDTVTVVRTDTIIRTVEVEKMKTLAPLPTSQRATRTPGWAWALAATLAAGIITQVIRVKQRLNKL
jgi:hypothetical protein